MLINARHLSQTILVFGVLFIAPVLPGETALTTPSASRTTPSLSYAERVEQILAEANPGGTVGIYVMDGETSEILVSRHADQPLKPASNNKLLTTAAGLHLLGPDYRFVTSVYARGAVTSGTLHGDLIVRGGGDPTISARFEDDKRDVTAIFRRWAEALNAAGIERVAGDIIADDTFFDEECVHPSWGGGELGEWYSAEVSALAFNDNCIDISWSAKDKVPGDRADFRLNPVTNYAQVDNNVSVVANGRFSERYYQRPSTLNSVLCTGTLTVDTLKDDSFAVHDGALYAVTVFRDVLSSQGVEVLGRARKLDPSGESTTSPGQLVFEHRSPPLTEVVNVINRNSQNFYAECLLKTLGRLKQGQGSFAAGGQVVEDFFTTAGVYNHGQDMVDGSGLSSHNRVSPRQLVEVIRLLDKGPYREAWRDSLPVGQTRGSLRSRFEQDAESKQLASRIMGKTGTIGGVRSLSGIIERPGRSPLYYSIVLNGFQVPGSQAVALIDKLAVALAKDSM